MTHAEHLEKRYEFLTSFYSKLSDKNLRMLVEKHNENHVDQLVMPEEGEFFRDSLVEMFIDAYDVTEHRGQVTHLYKGDFVQVLDPTIYHPADGEIVTNFLFSQRAQVADPTTITQKVDGWQFEGTIASPAFEAVIYDSKDSPPLQVKNIVAVASMSQNFIAPNNYIALDGANDYIQFTEIAGANENIMNFNAPTWSMGVSLEGVTDSSDYQHMAIASRGQHVMSFIRGGTGNWGFYVSGNGGSTRHGANTWYPLVDNSKILFTYQKPYLKYYQGNTDNGSYVLRATVTVQTAIHTTTNDSYVLKLGAGGGAGVWEGGFNNLLCSDQCFSGSQIGQFFQPGESYTDQPYFDDVTLYARLGEDEYPLVSDTLGNAVGELINGSPEDFASADGPSFNTGHVSIIIYTKDGDAIEALTSIGDQVEPGITLHDAELNNPSESFVSHIVLKANDAIPLEKFKIQSVGIIHSDDISSVTGFMIIFDPIYDSPRFMTAAEIAYYSDPFSKGSPPPVPTPEEAEALVDQYEAWEIEMSTRLFPLPDGVKAHYGYFQTLGPEEEPKRVDIDYETSLKSWNAFTQAAHYH